MMDRSQLREAVPGDAARLSQVLREAFEEYRGRLDPPSSAHDKTEALVMRELRDGGAFVAEADGVLRGCVFFHPKADHVYLDRLAVLPAFRGQGLSLRLMEAVESRARELGHSRVRLSVRLALESHHAWYARQGYGFHSHGTHAGYTSPTFLVLEKTLSAPGHR
ncbi:GNAT family N-acetyltransferase [Corallococcus sp. CA053C]|uniref:GNAT family N-acetyltransferase n=1 Tax=Corallococcus sp. CA053C TaxID=2316732 RepID=UPI000EA16B87|nr:GNAT family N-acetyltransferase [Corallococcus sp. CA053C]RKH11996.1 GNAT family N-acetyltransferase [Corallococcus sp. CA053C]